KPPPGVISSLPIPPLTSPRFGLIQEELAHSPFHLLVAVTFLIKTAGKTAIPVFWDLIKRFPTPEDLAKEDNKKEIIELIKPLGLSEHRYAIIQKYARGFVENPPTREKRYGVKNYPLMGDGKDVTAGEVFGAEELDAWEIGHLTQGAYTLDSWRIFCRDVLLGKAEDWTGKGARGEGFQPEWMRVLPKDKELRACLRWMWMREGWEWDPVTGDREPLREELRKAVDDSRVGYDDNGSLVILS
ncbi:DNA glycosylase, partial [Apiosordaria backusii]